MPIRTDHFFLEAFLDGDAYLAVADKRRFSTIDNQLNRATEIIGDGRIEGWEIIPHVFPNILVTLGNGLIDKFYVNTFGDKILELSENGTFYIYAQRRVGIIGIEGPKANITSIGYTDAGPPANVSNFNSELGSESSTPYFFDVVITWDANTDNDLSHYELERSDDFGDFEIIDDEISSSSTLYQDLVREEGTYQYRFYAVDLSGNRSAVAATDTVITPLSTTLPQNPIQVLTPQSEGAINILWKRPPAIPFDQVQYYKLTWVELNSDGTERTSTKQTKVVNRLLYNDRINDLITGQQYKITLQTVDIKDRESTGYVSNVIPQPNPAPRDPEGIAYSMVESGDGVEVTLSWTDGDTPYDPAITYRYKIYTTIDGKSESLGLDVPIGFTEEQVSLYTFNLLEYFPIPEDKLVTFRITSLDEAGFESSGSYIRLVTAIFSLPLRLSNVGATFDPDTQSITVTWKNQSDTRDVQIVIYNENEEDEYGSPLKIIDERLGLTEIFVLQNVELDQQYLIELTPYNRDGVAGPTSTIIELTSVSNDLPLPEPPTSIEVKTNDRQIVLTWNESSTAYTKEFNIYRKQDDITFFTEDWELIDTMPKSILRFSDYGLDNDTTYSYYITATDIYGRESLHLVDNAINLNFVQGIPKREGILTEPTDLALTLIGGNVTVTWDSLSEEFDGFTIYRSINNLHSWEVIATVDKDTSLYTDITLPLIDGTTFYYTVDKTINDAEILVQSTNVQPENSILLGRVDTSDLATSEYTINVSDRRDIKDLIDPLAEYTNRFLLPHRHREILPNDPDRIDLNPELIVTDWTTVDGRIFTTTEEDINGSSFILKVNGRFPSVFFSIDSIRRQIVFAEAIAEFDEETGSVIGEIPEIELRVLGVEEVQGQLDAFRFNNLHARQVQFGVLNREQLPEINHEGRIRETLFPERFLLERYNNHTFIVPQSNTDETKNFGDGTTFYAITEADGKVYEVIDWDLEDDDAVVGFRKPSFSPTTVLNLKQFSVSSSMSTSNDNANYYRFNQDGEFVVSSDPLTNGNIYFLRFSPQTNVLVGNPISGSYVISSFFVDGSNQKFYAVEYRGASDYYLTEIDPATGETITSVKFNGATSVIQHMEWANGVAYGVDNTGVGWKVYSVNLTTATTTLLHSIALLNVLGMAYVGDSGNETNDPAMYVITDNDALNVLNLSTGVVTSLGVLSITGATDVWYRESLGGSSSQEADKLYYSDGTDIYRIDDRDIASDTSMATWSISELSSGYTFNDDWWKNGYNILRIGDFTGLKSDIFLRFPVNIPAGATVGTADLILTADESNPGNGNTVRLEISIVDPEEYGDATDLSFSSIASLNTIGSLYWNPPLWAASERSDNTTVDISSLVQEFINHDSYYSGRHIIVKIKTLDITAEGHYRNAESFDAGIDAPSLEMSYANDTAKVTSEPSGFQSEKAYDLSFEFQDNEPTRWVRITSYNAPSKPNPIIELSKRLRFRYYMEEGYSLYLTLGIREISGTNQTIGDDGGITGPIEWVGINSLATDNFGNEAPVGVKLEGTGEWQEVDIDLQRAGVSAFVEGGGNGILNKIGYGVLEHLALTIDPDSDNPTGPFNLRIDKLEQVSDLLVAGTSRGILTSQDFGTTWELSRLTDTPVHKFYKARNNRYIWAISATEVLLATDPAFWFSTQGTTGIEYIRDITDDSDGNIFISTDKGVYWLEVSLLETFSVFRQTQPVNAFSTDAFAIYHNGVSSGIDEIWVSTEIGIYRTDDFGITWQDTGLDTAGLVSFQIINIGTTSQPILIASTRKHILRKLYNEPQFQVIANFEDQHNIFDIWKIAYFDDRLYVSTGSGVYSNDLDLLKSPGISTIPFKRVLESLDFNGFTQIAFGLDVVDLGDIGSRLMIGLENRLAQVKEDNSVSFKSVFANKELPSFYIDDQEVTIGYIYNAFNNVVCFRESVLVNKIATASNIPRRSFFARHGGWSQTNPDTEVFIYKNGFPTWLDFDFDSNSILGEMQLLDGKLRTLETLTTFNSLLPDAQNLLNALLTDITNIRTGGDNSTPLITDSTLIQFMDDYTKFLSVITESYANRNELSPVQIIRTGIPRSQRSAGNRAAVLEAKEDFEADDSTGINIDIVTGEVDFTTAYSNATDPEDRDRFTFDKFDHMNITIFNANVSGTGEYTHRELEDRMEDINTGLTSDLAKTAYTNLIKSGIFLEQQHNYLFDRYNVSNIQSKFYVAHTNEWYDILNSTVDYKLILKVDNTPELRFVNVATLFDQDPYFNKKIWIGTDDNIVQFGFDENDELVLENFIQIDPFESLFIWDIWSPDGGTIYVVTANQETGRGRIFVTHNFGLTWTEEETINLPNQIYTFRIINGNKVVTTEEGVFYNDNSFGTYFKSDVVPSDNLSETSPSLTAFFEPTFNLIKSTFMILESDRWFYTSGQGIEFFALAGQLTLNSAKIVNAILRHKNLTWVGTDKGLYNDGNSLLSDSVQWGLQTIENTLSESSEVQINTITSGVDALYVGAANGKIYRYLDEIPGDDTGNEWKSYRVPNFGPIHKMILLEDINRLVVMSYNKARALDVSIDNGVFQ